MRVSEGEASQRERGHPLNDTGRHALLGFFLVFLEPPLLAPQLPFGVARAEPARSLEGTRGGT